MNTVRAMLSGLLLVLALSAQAQTLLPRQSAASPPVPDPNAPLYQHTGEQYRIYEFPGTGEPIPYRLFVPEAWTPEQRLPVLVTLRAGNSINNNHRAPNTLVSEARERGYIVVSPLGYRGISQPYYGSRFPVIRPNGPSVPAQGWTEEEDLRAEQDVLYVLNLVAAEYNADLGRLFIHGQNPSGSGALHLAASYPDIFSAAVVSSGPIVTSDFPFAALRDKVAVMVLHGDQDTNNPLAASEQMASEFRAQGIDTEFHVIPGGEHLTAYLYFTDGIFDFLDRH